MTFNVRKSKEAKKQKHYFVMTGDNGEPMPVSEMYSSRRTMMKTIATIQREAATAKIRYPDD